MAPTTASSPSSLTLTYFDIAGPAEPVRMALAMTGQPWEDKRISFSELPAIKPGKLVGLCKTSPFLYVRQINCLVLPGAVGRVKHIYLFVFPVCRSLLVSKVIDRLLQVFKTI